MGVGGTWDSASGLCGAAQKEYSLAIPTPTQAGSTVPRFTMGARPVVSLDSLRFGPIHGDTAQHKWNRSRFAGVVSGIAHYGNCIGVPTIGGEG